jgi:hypothetical protein
MESQITELLEINNADRENNDKLAGLSEDGPVTYLTMAADELLNAAASLHALSFQIQRFQSDNEASAARIERYLNMKVNTAASQYQGYWEERKVKALNESEHLTGVAQELSKFKQKADQHKSLTFSINKMADILAKKADLKSRKWRD